jgi:hypothetical protein
MIHGGFHVDQGFVAAQTVDHSEQGLVEVVLEISAVGERPYAEGVAV